MECDRSPSARLEFALSVIERLNRQGFTAFFAGGCVRDQLLGKAPKDYDVATSATPEEIRKLFGYRRTLAIGAAFGVISVLSPIREAGQVEVATFRADLGYSDGRHPNAVQFTNAKNDALRRDFTINGMFFDPRENRVIDYVGGQVDLQNRVVRAIGNPLERFAEDKLRMLRAVRFAGRLGFELERQTRAAIVQMADEIQVVSPERIAQEMRQIFTAQQPLAMIKQLRNTGLLPQVLPQVEGLQVSDWELVDQVLSRLQEASFPAVLALLLHRHSRAEEAAQAVTQQWRLANKESQQTLWLLQHWHALTAAADQPWSKLQPVLISEPIHDLLALHKAREQAGLTPLEDRAFCEQQLALEPERLNPAPLLSGYDLQLAGIPQGKIYSQLLQKTRDAQLDGQIDSKQDALALVAQLWNSDQTMPD